MDELVKRLRTECTLPFQTLQLMREAADAIEELQKARDAACWGCKCKKMEPTCWIPVTERLPEHMKDVLVWVSIGKAPLVAYDVDCYNEHAKRWVCFENNVTHWMPLPEPPKEE